MRAAFLPLLDAAPLIAAARMGFATSEGLDIILERESSWASLRDRVAVGHLDAAHMLAPMPIASNLGLTPLAVRLVVPMALGYGGNSLTVSGALAVALVGEHGMPLTGDAASAGAALAKVVRDRSRRGADKLTIGVVHTHSAHYYQIAYWLAVAGVDPVNDVDIVVVPPPLTAPALAGGQIDAFCAGEPWGSFAAREAGGYILLTNESIWRSSPEKVLGVRGAWYEDDRERTLALVRSIYRAAQWCDDADNEADLARLLSGREMLNVDVAVIEEGLSRRRTQGSGKPSGFLTFAQHGAAFPWLSHAAWFYSQMTRWKQTQFSAAGLQIARATYRPDIHRAALKPLAADLPAANSKVEGMLSMPTPAGSSGGRLLLGPDVFFDGKIFDPDKIEDYLEQ